MVLRKVSFSSNYMTVKFKYSQVYNKMKELQEKVNGMYVEKEEEVASYVRCLLLFVLQRLPLLERIKRIVLIFSVCILFDT